MRSIIDAARSGSLEEVRSFLENDSDDANARDEYEQTPLHLASEKGHLQIVECLLENGADINARNVNLMSPLQFAIWNDRLSIVQCLVENRANINVRNAQGDTPLHAAVCRGDLSIVKYLVKHGADLNARNQHNLTPEIVARGQRRHIEVLNYLEKTVKVRQCHSLILYLVQKGFWDNKKKALKRK